MGVLTPPPDAQKKERSLPGGCRDATALQQGWWHQAGSRMRHRSCTPSMVLLLVPAGSLLLSSLLWDGVTPQQQAERVSPAHRMAEDGWDLGRPSGPTPAQPVPPRAGCPGPYPGGFEYLQGSTVSLNRERACTGHPGLGPAVRVALASTGTLCSAGKLDPRRAGGWGWRLCAGSSYTWPPLER